MRDALNHRKVFRRARKSNELRALGNLLYYLGLQWRHETFGERSAVERWFGVFKQRAKLFWKRWPHNAGPDDTGSWCLAFAALYNLWEG